MIKVNQKFEIKDAMSHVTTAASDIDAVLLATYLSQHIAGFSAPIAITKFPGGQSNPTYRLQTPHGDFVLRRKPAGTLLKSAHAVDREFQVLSALAGSNVPVAKAFHLCEDDSVIGSMFYIMEYVDGRVMWDPSLPGESHASRAAIYNEMNRVLACIHSLDIDAAGLSQYGKAGNYYERQMSRWVTQYRASETETISEMEHLIDWLVANTPADDGRVSLVHGDFRLDNMMFAKHDARVIAVVDWELSTLGHPFADLAYQCMQWRMPHQGELSGLGGLDREALGIPSEADYIAQYCSRMGIEGIDNWPFYLAFSFFRLAAILQGVKKRALDGNASSAKAMKMGAFVKPLAAMAIELLEE